MAVTRSGVFSETPATGEWAYGVSGVGSLLVNGGSLLKMVSTAAGGPFVRVGQYSGGDGTMTITGAGSTVQVNSAGSTLSGNGAGLQIGRDGAVGVVNVLAGGALRIVDPALPASNYMGGEEYLFVGRGAAGNGTLNINAGEVEVRGTGSVVQVGVEGATGTVNLSNGSFLRMIVNAPGDGHMAALRVGRDGGTGLAVVGNSTVLIENRGTYEAYMPVGRNGTGTMTVTGTGAANHGVFLYGGSDDVAFVDIGRGATGNGILSIANATLRLQNNGIGFDGTAYGTGGSAGMRIGREAGTGQVSVSGGKIELLATKHSGIIVGDTTNFAPATGTLSLSAGSLLRIVLLEGDGPQQLNDYWEAYMYVGKDESTGFVTVDRSTVLLENRQVDDAYLGVGRFGTGTMTVTGTGAADHGVFLHGGDEDYAFVDIGRGTFGFGTVSIANATLRLQNDGIGFDGTVYGIGGYAEMAIGRGGGTGSLTLTDRARVVLEARESAGIMVGTEGGTGTLSANHATLSVATEEEDARIIVGMWAGSEGTMTLANNSLVTIDASTLAVLGLGIGGVGATGTMTVTHSTVQVTGDDWALITLGTGSGLGGYWFEPGTGTLTLDDQAQVVIDSAGEAGLWIGAQPGAIGTMTVTRNSTVDISGATGANVLIGTYGGTGRLTVGGGSSVTGFDTARIGEAGGSGRLTLAEGGQFGAAGSTTWVMKDGVVAAGLGTLGGNLALARGTIDMRAQSLAQLHVTGNAVFGEGTIWLDIGAAANDRIRIDGASLLAAPAGGDATLFALQLIEGRILAAGQSVTLVEAATIAFDPEALLDAAVTGGGAGFSWVFGQTVAQPDRLVLTALNRSDTGSGTGTLLLSGTTAATVEWDAGLGIWAVAGGGWAQGVAHNLGRVVGTQSADVFNATGFTTSIQFDAGAADDMVFGGLGNDVLIGGRGRDALVGGAGYDRLYGDGPQAWHWMEQAQAVYRLYQATLDRAPDAAGQLGWTMQLADGTASLQQVAAGFVGSPEFLKVYGALANSDFVELLYQNVLGRPADAAGLAGWTSQLQAGVTRGQVVLGFSESREFRISSNAASTEFTLAADPAGWADDVYRLYAATLNREPDLDGFMGWTAFIANGTTFQTTVNGFVSSREFLNTYGTLSDTAFVELLYQNVLGRPADPGGLAGWTAQLADGVSRAEVVRGFSQSGEFVNATAAGLKAWVRAQGVDDRLAGGTGDNALWGGILADEFRFNAHEPGTHRVMDLESWDYLNFQGFGYDDPGAARAHMVQQGTDVVFADQNVTVILANTQLGSIVDDMIWV